MKAMQQTGKWRKRKWRETPAPFRFAELDCCVHSGFIISCS